MFDNKIYRVIFLDQRDQVNLFQRLLKNNALYHLIEDIDYIRKFLKIDSWFIVGGSWGSTFAIAYGEKYPNYVKIVVLRSLFLGTDDEVEWAFRVGPLTFKLI